MTSVVRLGALALGLVCSCLGAYGAFEFALKLEGNAVTYLVLAAPVIAGAAASIPVLAEACWRERAYLKALLWWAALIPAGAVVFFSSAERVHVAKAGAQAERSALRSAASRAQAALTKSEASMAQARAEANAVRAQRQCGPTCRTKLAAEAAAQADVEAGRRELLSAESKATTDSRHQAPAWLLPAALDLVAFMAIWTAFSGGRSKPATAWNPTVRGTRRRAKRSQPRAPKPVDARAKAEAYFRRGASNDNVVRLPAA